MSKRVGLLIVPAIVIIVCLMAAREHGASSNESDRSSDVSIYNKNPDHLWNRIHQHFFMRATADGTVYGQDELDPLLWDQTKYLRRGPSYKKAINLLDEFLLSRGERLIADPLKHAIFQRDLWAVFDWIQRVSPDDRELSSRLAAVIKRLALSSDQIRALPDSYADAIAAKEFPVEPDAQHPDDPFLQPELFKANGPWVQITGDAEIPAAPVHTQAFSRSYFSVFLRLPGGRQQTIDYLKQLKSFSTPVIKSHYFPGQMGINPDVPRFPVGTMCALVRRMMLVDDKGHIVPTRIVESVQFRVHRKLVDGFTDYEMRNTYADKFEFRLRRTLLFNGQSVVLEPITEELFNQFLSHGDDPFEMSANSAVADSNPHPLPVRAKCTSCHDNMTGISGIGSVMSFTRFGAPVTSVNKLVESDPKKEIELAIRNKQGRKDWESLRQFMDAR